MFPWQATVQNEKGDAVVSPVVTVYKEDGSSLADIYDASGAALPNPLTGTTEGFVQFYVRDTGIYNIIGEKAGTLTPKWNVWLGDWSQPFPSLAAFNAAVIPGPVARVQVVSGGQLVGFTRGSPIPGIKAGWVPDGEVTPDHFEENVSPGETDMRSAILSAIDCSSLGWAGRFRHGFYATSGEIRWKAGARFKGAGQWSAMSSTSMAANQLTVVKYIGADNPDISVMNFSNLSVGVEGSSSNQMENASCTDITIDAGLAGFGAYWNRSFNMNCWDRITVTGSTRHGFWAGNVWVGSPTNWISYKTRGCGITCGVNTFGWSQCTFDQVELINPFAYFTGVSSGTGTQTIRLNAFKDNGLPADLFLEAGITIGNTRGSVLIGGQGAQCGGFGLLLTEGSQIPLTIIGGYLEGNGKSTGATVRQWDLGVNVSATRLSTVIRGMHFGLRTTGGIKIWGSPNTGRPEMAISIEDCGFLPPIDASHRYYKLINAPAETEFMALRPVGYVASQNVMRGGAPIGRAYLALDAAGEPVLTSVSGCIQSAVKTGSGTIRIDFDPNNQPTSGAFHAAFGPVDNRQLGVSARSTSSMSVVIRNGSGALVDAATNPCLIVIYPPI